MTLYSTGLLIVNHIQIKKRRQMQAWKQLKPLGKTVDVKLFKQDSCCLWVWSSLQQFALSVWTVFISSKKKNTLHMIVAFIRCSFVNFYVSRVILREGSKALALHSRWHTSQATKRWEVISLFVAGEAGKPCGRGDGAENTSAPSPLNSSSIFRVTILTIKVGSQKMSQL